MKNLALSRKALKNHAKMESTYLLPKKAKFFAESNILMIDIFYVKDLLSQKSVRP